MRLVLTLFLLKQDALNQLQCNRLLFNKQTASHSPHSRLSFPVQAHAQQGAQPLLRVKVGQPDL